jgi:AhpD family alkylhydroperoxidase
VPNGVRAGKMRGPIDAQMVPRQASPSAAPAQSFSFDMYCVEVTRMMLDWNEYHRQLMASIDEMSRLSPEVVESYVGLSEAGQKKNLLGAKTRELIALAVAVTVRCDGCIAVHTDAAVRNGATREEIAEALGVAVTVNAGATLVYSTRVLDAFAAGPT